MNCCKEKEHRKNCIFFFTGDMIHLVKELGEQGEMRMMMVVVVVL